MKFPEELQYIQNSLKPQSSTDARMDGRICVITGTTSGIGFEAAKQFAKGGAHLVMICRSMEKGRQLQRRLSQEYGVSIDLFIADFQKLAEVQQVGMAVRQKYPEINVLVNNIGIFNKRHRLTTDGNEMTLGVIHLSSFLLTKLLLDNLKEGAPSRVLYISSEAHRFGGFSLKDPNWKKRPYIALLAYGSAKIAQIHTTLMFAEKHMGSDVTFNLMHPGAVRTNIGMNNGFLYRFYSRYILGLFLRDPACSGEAIYYLAADPGLEKITGKFFNRTIQEKPAWYTVKAKTREAVWRWSEALVRPYLEDKP